MDEKIITTVDAKIDLEKDKKNKKHKKIALISTVILLSCGLIAFLIFQGLEEQAKRQAEEQAAAERQQIDIDFVEGLVSPVAAKYDIDDIVVDHMEDSIFIDCYLNSEDFSRLSNRDKLNFIKDLDEKADLDKNKLPTGGNYEGEKLDIIIVSNSHEYSGGTPYGFSEYNLYKDKQTIYTEDSSSNGSSSNSKVKIKCSSCNGTGYVREYYSTDEWDSRLGGRDKTCSKCHGKGYI